MGNPTDELRAKLDELGISWVAIAENATEYAHEGIVYRAYEVCDGLQAAIITPVTPEQAIAATVGEHECKKCAHDRWEGKPFTEYALHVAQELSDEAFELLDGCDEPDYSAIDRIHWHCAGIIDAAILRRFGKCQSERAGGYGIQFADWCDFPPETMVGETVFDGDGNAIGWIVNATVGACKGEIEP